MTQAMFDLPLFVDRRAAGRALARRLAPFGGAGVLVLALPRGGVPVAYEVAHALGAELDLLFVRKLSAPGHPELGIGAVIDGADPQMVLNEDIMRHVRPSEAYLSAELDRQLAEITRRRHAYVGGRPAAPVSGRTVIIVDDGIATGGTVKAALRGVRRNHPAHLILAVPLAPADVLPDLRRECDEVICLATPDPFYAVGAHYSVFTQTTDDEVRDLVTRAAREHAASAGHG